ncbi:NADH-quinone oxidoreductase subunit J [bacterium]|nr:NADH-quinone oxidoreductase subunit J [bacterium]
MSPEAIFFYLFAVMAVAFSLVTVLKRNPAVGAFSLVLVFFSFAGIYAILGAHLVAALQVVVYAGAIMVLLIFVIMLLNADSPSLDMDRTHWTLRALSLAGCATLFAFFVWAFQNGSLFPQPGQFPPQRVAELGGSTKLISYLMFTEYLYPFEVTSALILAGIVGSVTLAKRQKVKRGKA